MSHLISGMGGEFEKLTAFDNISSEAPWQNGLVERNGGIWKAAARKAIKDVGVRGFLEMRRLASMVNWQKNAHINSSGYRSRVQIALVTSGREAEWRIGIAGVAR